MVEPVAGVLGAWAVTVARPILPYALAFAAGAMIFVVLDDLVPETCHGYVWGILTPSSGSSPCILYLSWIYSSPILDLFFSRVPFDSNTDILIVYVHSSVGVCRQLLRYTGILIVYVHVIGSSCRLLLRFHTMLPLSVQKCCAMAASI